LNSLNMINDKIKGILSGHTFYYYMAYFPFIGWLIPLYVRENDQLAQYHGKTGLVLSVSCILPALFLFLLNFISPLDWRIFRFILVVMIYCIYAVYAAILTAGIYSVYNEKTLQPGVLKKIIDKLPV